MATKVLDPHLWNLENLFKSMYDVPVYQRPYSWDKEQVDVLMEDIIDAFCSESRDEGYYTGNIIVYDKNDKINGLITKYDIIDGQQRITTFSLVLLALYSLSISIGVDKNDPTLGNMKAALWKYVNREYNKDLKAVTLNSIEKKCFSDLYDHCFASPSTIISFCSNYHCKSRFDERVIANFTIIYETIRTKISADDQNKILDFSDYVLQYINFIVIEANCRPNKVFSMFESINSKGKKLEEIDLIKTYIFSQLDEASYSIYLDKWGELIIKTNDNLYDYLYNYIKAYLCFYRQNITIVNFKSISRNELLRFFNETSISEALKKMLDDMYEKVDFYNMLSSASDAYKLVKNGKFRFYYKVFTEISYKHPKALFMRTLIEYKEGKLSKDEVVSIVSETVSFMMKFLTISNRDSKDAITMFSNIMNDIYACGVTKEIVSGAIATELFKQGITAEKIKEDLKAMDAYEQNKRLSISLLSLYEATSKDNSGKIKTSYDQAYTILSSFSEAFSLDHLLVQTPDPASTSFMYYKDESLNSLVLKAGNDFPSEIVNGMDYDTFSRKVLNQIGNLRIYYKDKNSGRHNTSIELKEYDNFTTYQNIVDRGTDLIDVLVDFCLPDPEIDASQLQAINSKKSEANLPKMDKLIEFGLIKPGDKVYITVSSDDSTATLIDGKYVDYQGEKLTLNDWGCRITGWKSIRIYAYVAIVGEIETLHQKRLSYIQEYNESVS